MDISLYLSLLQRSHEENCEAERERAKETLEAAVQQERVRGMVRVPPFGDCVDVVRYSVRLFVCMYVWTLRKKEVYFCKHWVILLLEN